jgi:hypothetical protein
LPYGAHSYSGFFTASQAFDTGKLGVDRVGFYAMVGEAPTTWLTQFNSGGGVLAGSGTGQSRSTSGLPVCSRIMARME